MDLNAILLPILAFLFLALLVLIAIAVINHFRGHGRMIKSFDTQYFIVLLPKESLKEEGARKKEAKELIAIQEQLLSGFSNIKAKGLFSEFWYGSPHLTFEIIAFNKQIGFYISIPNRFVNLAIKQIQAFYPDAEINKINEFTFFNFQNKIVGSSAVLSKDSILPLVTYDILEKDALESILISMGQIHESEATAIQFIFRPLKFFKERDKKISNVIKAMRSGQSLNEALSLKKTVIEEIGGKALFDQKKSESQTQVAPSLRQEQEDIIKAIEKKASQLSFEVNIRLIASAETSEHSQSILEDMETAFIQFSSPKLNSFQFKKASKKNLIYDFAFRNFSSKNKMVLSANELAGLFHFPLPETPVPQIQWLRAKSSSAPANTPQEGIILGENTFRNEKKIIRFKHDDRRRHFYVIGQTGTGKSSLFFEMIKQDIENGEGIAVIDPHGSLVEDILSIIPDSRNDDVVYFNPADTERPFGLNMLEYKSKEQKDFTVQEMIAIFMKLFPPEIIGPMFEHNMRNAMLVLMADEEAPGTIVEIPRIFTDEAFMRYKLEKVTDPIVRDFWEKEAAKTTEFHKSEMLGYLVSKVGRFIENEMIRNIIGQSHSSFNVREIMDTGKILLVNLSKGKIGEINSSLLGLILVAKIQMAALSREDVVEESARRDFHLYMDEFQNFTTDSISTILAEARKYRLSLNIAHQFIGQLEEKIRKSVFGNVGTLMSFRIGAEDAEFLVKYFAPKFTARDLTNISNFNAYIKLMINGETSEPFNLRIFSPQKGVHNKGEVLKELSRERYGRDKAIVEQEIIEKLRGQDSNQRPAMAGEAQK